MTSRYDAYHAFLVDQVLTPFYDKRLVAIESLTLDKILRRKNPYLFKAKNLEVVGDLVRSILEAHLSSQEETLFGNLLEGFAIDVSRLSDNGFKSAFKSVDLEFTRADVHYIVSIKSGTNWGNADQIARMRDNFEKARKALAEQGKTAIMAINGCMYGFESNHFKADENPNRSYYKLAGQDFWAFISQDDMLYQTIVVPIGHEARRKDERFQAARARKENQLTQDFTARFMTADNWIDWERLIDFVSKRRGAFPALP